MKRVVLRIGCGAVCTCLLYTSTQGSLQQVGSGVVAGNGHAVALVHLCGQHIAHLHDTALQHAGVDLSLIHIFGSLPRPNP